MIGEDATFMFEEWKGFCFGERSGAIMIYNGAKHTVRGGDGCHLH